jgi:hypothetical protein
MRDYVGQVNEAVDPAQLLGCFGHAGRSCMRFRELRQERFDVVLVTVAASSGMP